MSTIGITFSSTIDDGLKKKIKNLKIKIAIDIISEYVSGGSISNIVNSVGSFEEKLIANFMK